jgi:hypothetical protein
VCEEAIYNYQVLHWFECTTKQFDTKLQSNFVLQSNLQSVTFTRRHKSKAAEISLKFCKFSNIFSSWDDSPT